MGQRILVVDDLPINRRLLHAVLTGEGYEVVEARDGVEALEQLRTHQVDGIVSDILMPNMDGYRFCREIRAQPALQHLPFLFYTSTYISPEDEHLAKVCGGDGYLRKPAPTGLLLNTVAELLRRTQTIRATPAPEVADSAVMDYYNAALVRKLEEKNAELAEARDRLELANQELEARVAARTAELVVANEELDAFSQSIAHDLRSPLTTISLLASMLREDESQKPVAQEWKEQVLEIEQTAQRMDALVEDLLSLARASRGEMKRQPVNLSDLVSEIMQRCAALDPERQVQASVLPTSSISGDEGLLRIALENLVQNAWKYTARTAHARITFGRVAQEPSTYYLEDNGAGFDESAATRLFQPFVRLHSAQEFPGTGIGLTTVRRIISRHGGRIWAHAAPGQGATFYFTIPSEAASPASDAGLGFAPVSA